MLSLAQTQTLTAASQRLLPPCLESLITPCTSLPKSIASADIIESHRNSLITITTDPNQSLVFLAFFSIRRAGGRLFRLTQQSSARRPLSPHQPLVAHHCLFLIATMNY